MAFYVPEVAGGGIATGGVRKNGLIGTFAAGAT